MRRLKLIVITWPQFLEDEAALLELLLDRGVWRIHLRKPDASYMQLSDLLRQIAPKYHRKIVIHDHYELMHEFDLAGVHLNQRNQNHPNASSPYSCSCHSIGELSLYRQKVRYMFLSPVFDSISKAGYGKQFTHAELHNATQSNIIGCDTIALGGIDAENIKIITQYGFGGVAVLGALWLPYVATPDRELLIHTLDKLLR